MSIGEERREAGEGASDLGLGWGVNQVESVWISESWSFTKTRIERGRSLHSLCLLALWTLGTEAGEVVGAGDASDVLLLTVRT